MNTVAEIYGRRPPKPWVYKKEVNCTNPNLIVGLELETENCRHSEDFYIENGRPLGIEVKTDNSLRTINHNAAYEFITKPTQMKNVLATLADFFDKTMFNDENYSDRCSVHVHVNCCDLTFEQVCSVALIYTVVEKILFEFVNKRPGVKDGWSRDTNIYCVPWYQCRDHLNLVYNFTQNPTRALNVWQKYTAVNLIPLGRLGTMEWRQMHGTADMAKLTQWLNIIGSIYKHATTVPFDDLVKDIQSLNTVSHYGKFFETVLGGQLPYNDVYRQAMEEGCILAKYSMISWSLDKKSPGRYETKTKTVPPLGEVAWAQPQFAQPNDEDIEAMLRNAPRAAEPDLRPRPLRVNVAAQPQAPIRWDQALADRVAQRAAREQAGVGQIYDDVVVEAPRQALTNEQQMLARRQAELEDALADQRLRRERERAAIRRNVLGR
jgi:hypothetical protein